MMTVDDLIMKASSPKSMAAARFLLVRIAFYFLALYLRILQSALYLFGFGWSSIERCLQYASALGDDWTFGPLPALAGHPPRTASPADARGETGACTCL